MNSDTNWWGLKKIRFNRVTIIQKQQEIIFLPFQEDLSCQREPNLGHLRRSLLNESNLLNARSQPKIASKTPIMPGAQNPSRLKQSTSNIQVAYKPNLVQTVQSDGILQPRP